MGRKEWELYPQIRQWPWHTGRHAVQSSLAYQHQSPAPTNPPPSSACPSAILRHAVLSWPRRRMGGSRCTSSSCATKSEGGTYTCRLQVAVMVEVQHCPPVPASRTARVDPSLAALPSNMPQRIPPMASLPRSSSPSPPAAAPAAARWWPARRSTAASRHQPKARCRGCLQGGSGAWPQWQQPCEIQGCSRCAA